MLSPVGGRSLFLSVRRSLSNNFIANANAFLQKLEGNVHVDEVKAQGWQNYLENRKNEVEASWQSVRSKEFLIKARNLAISPESFHKLNNAGQYDVLLLDEIASIRRSFSSETHYRRDAPERWLENANAFAACLKQARKILVLDADLTDTEMDLLLYFLKPQEITIVANKVPRERRRAYQLPAPASSFVIRKTMKKLAEGLEPEKIQKRLDKQTVLFRFLEEQTQKGVPYICAFGSRQKCEFFSDYLQENTSIGDQLFTYTNKTPPLLGQVHGLMAKCIGCKPHQ